MDMSGEHRRKEEMNTNKQEYPYERFEMVGPHALTDTELIAIILRTGTVGEDVMSLSRKVLNLRSGKKQGLLALGSIPMEELTKIKGIGKVKAIRLKCVAEICSRMQMQKDETGLFFDTPDKVANYYMERLRHLETEHIYLILTDNKNRFIKEILLAKGTVNTAVLSAREIFIEALRYQAVHILLLHNHPSGDATPSLEDIQITHQIMEASRLMNILLVDHIIVGDNTFTSLKEKGYL